MLSRAGYEVDCASKGEEAVSLYSNALLANKSFDLVILDITIRSGAGGEETFSEMLKIALELRRLRRRDIPPSLICFGSRDAASQRRCPSHTPDMSCSAW
jgi:DNA-binding response OmpR family regulator